MTNKMNNPFFVSLEFATLAKLYGFNEKCLAYYDTRSQQMTMCNHPLTIGVKNSTFDYIGYAVTVPTYSQLEGWLRDDHGLHILTNRIYCLPDKEELGWFYKIYNIEMETNTNSVATEDGFYTQNDAWSKAVKICFQFIQNVKEEEEFLQNH